MRRSRAGVARPFVYLGRLRRFVTRRLLERVPGEGMNDEMDQLIASVVGASVLLVAADFDGTLSDLVARPADAAANPRATAALERMSRMPRTHVAIISGRGLEDLRARLPERHEWMMAGSHGAEVDGVRTPPVDDDVRAELDEVERSLLAVAAEHPGCEIERKPRGVALHVRRADPAVRRPMMERVRRVGADHPRLHPRVGSEVVEIVADASTKADALAVFRRRCGASAVLFIGDDRTDEDAFAALGQGDVGVKVGSGPTLASHRIDGVGSVATLLDRLATARDARVRPQDLEAINAVSLLSDQRSLGLVTSRGRLAWLCMPRVDSTPIMADLVGGPDAGFFEASPLDEAAAPRVEFDGDSHVVRTRWDRCSLTDYFACSPGGPQRSRRSVLVRAIEGRGTCRLRFAPRFDFGRVVTRLTLRADGVEVRAGAATLFLHSPGVEWRVGEDGAHQTATADLDLSAGPFVLELWPGGPRSGPRARDERERRDRTRRFWSDWAARLALPATLRDRVRRSAITLRGLTHGPTGAIVAAGTTGLPSHLGGLRNWDYRFCWLRDASMAAHALARLGDTATAQRLLDWISRVVARDGSGLRPVYAVDGREVPAEEEVVGPRGYGGSLPIRVGNAAALQVQLDVAGSVVSLVAQLAGQGVPISPEHERLTDALVRDVASRWHEPDHGIWEVRGPARHHVHSKVMGFLAVDAAMRVHEATGVSADPAWRRLRDRMRDEIVERGFDPARGAFVAWYGGHELDAATLWVLLAGVLPPDDSRVVSTVDAIDRELRVGNAVHRYRYDDGLPGRDSAFHLCTGWLVESMVAIGRTDEAHRLLMALGAAAGPGGLMSEGVDPVFGMALGNVPQAYSHVALINAALAVERAAGAAGGDT